jgi:predicted XRE-type DNA-binding protein
MTDMSERKFTSVHRKFTPQEKRRFEAGKKWAEKHPAELNREAVEAFTKMEAATRSTPPRRRRSGIRSRVIAEPEVLARFSDAELEAMEKRVGGDIHATELRQLSAAADAAYDRVKSVEQMLVALRAARVRKGLSQARVDELSGIGRANVSRLENLHLDNPTLETVLRYAQAVGLKVTLQPIK